MLYAFVRPLAKIGISIFFRRIYLTHTENIPKDKPVILACNHPTAFLEPCILACFLDRPLYYLVRGDFFKKEVYNFLLRALHMLPVYRRRDGDFSKLKDNFATFDACFDTLKKNKTLMVFPEGHTVLEYRLRPLKKGVGRIVMGFFEKYPEIEELYVVPVGVNYTDAFRFRSDVMLEFGRPMRMKAYYEQYKNSPNEGVMAILKDLYPAMKEEMIVVEEPRRDILANRLLELDRARRSDHLWPVLSRDEQALRSERAVAKSVNALPEDQLKAMEKKMDHYLIQLSRHGITDHTLLRGNRKLTSHYLKAALFALPAFLGYWLNYPFINTARTTVNKKVKRIEYFSPVLIGTSIGIYTTLFLFLILLGLFINWWILLLIPLLFFSGLAYIAYDHHREIIRQERKRRKISEPRQQELLKMRMEFLLKGMESV